MFKQALMGALAAAAVALPALAQDAYVIGVSGALTGPSASTNAPPIEGLRLYVDRLNAAGGIAGKKIQLILQDRIQNGGWSRTGSFPSERELCMEFEVSRPTIRQALSQIYPAVTNTHKTKPFRALVFLQNLMGDTDDGPAHILFV